MEVRVVEQVILAVGGRSTQAFVCTFSSHVRLEAVIAKRVFLGRWAAPHPDTGIRIP